MMELYNNMEEMSPLFHLSIIRQRISCRRALSTAHFSRLLILNLSSIQLPRSLNSIIFLFMPVSMLRSSSCRAHARDCCMREETDLLSSAPFPVRCLAPFLLHPIPSRQEESRVEQSESRELLRVETEQKGGED